MKKCLALFLCVCFVFSLAGCNSGVFTPDNSSGSTSDGSAQDSSSSSEDSAPVGVTGYLGLKKDDIQSLLGYSVSSTQNSAETPGTFTEIYPNELTLEYENDQVSAVVVGLEQNFDFSLTEIPDNDYDLFGVKLKNTLKEASEILKPYGEGKLSTSESVYSVYEFDLTKDEESYRLTLYTLSNQSDAIYRMKIVKTLFSNGPSSSTPGGKKEETLMSQIDQLMKSNYKLSVYKSKDVSHFFPVVVNGVTKKTYFETVVDANGKVPSIAVHCTDDDYTTFVSAAYCGMLAFDGSLATEDLVTIMDEAQKTQYVKKNGVTYFLERKDSTISFFITTADVSASSSSSSGS